MSLGYVVLSHRSIFLEAQKGFDRSCQFCLTLNDLLNERFSRKKLDINLSLSFIDANFILL